MSSQTSPKKLKNAVGNDNLSTKVTQSTVSECLNNSPKLNSLVTAGVTMALLPSNGDEESCTHKDSQKRIVHNEVERRRKVKINNYIGNLAKLLPNKDGRKWSKNETLQKAVDYIHEVKEAHEKMLLGKVDEVQAVELTRLKQRIEELELQNANYVKLFTLAGISPSTDTLDQLTKCKDGVVKIDPKMFIMGENGAVVLRSPTPPPPQPTTTTVEKDVVPGTGLKEETGDECKTTLSSDTKKKKKRSSTSKNHHRKESGDNSNKMKSNGTTSSPVTNSRISPEVTTVSTSTWLPQMTVEASCVGLTSDTLITQATGCVTAVTQTLPGGPIMSTSQQHQQSTTVMPQLPLLNFGTPVSVMQTPVQPMITINEQGIPVLQVTTTHHPQLGNGQVIVNGHPTQLECQAGATQGIIQTDAGIILSNHAARYASTSNGTAQVQLVTSPAVSLSQVISGAHGAANMLGTAPMQQGTTTTMLTTSSSSNLPSAFMLPNGQIIPVVREPSILYSNTGNLLMAAGASQAVISTSTALHQQQQQQQSQQAIATNHKTCQDVNVLSATAAMLPEMLPPCSVRQATPPRPLSTSSSTLDLAVPPAVLPQDNGLSSSSQSVVQNSSCSSHGSSVTRRTHRAIKPKPAVTSVTSNVSNSKPKKRNSAGANSAQQLTADVTVKTKRATMTQVTTVESSAVVAESPKSVPEKRPSSSSSMVTDILAQATESIFAITTSDSISPSSTNFCPTNGTGSDQSMTSVKSKTITDNNEDNPESQVPTLKDNGQQQQQQQQTVDILSDLVCEVYRTNSVTPPQQIQDPVDIPEAKTLVDEFVPSTTELPESTSLTLTDTIATVPFDQSAVQDDQSKTGSKRSCSYDEDLPASAKRLRDNDEDSGIESLLNKDNELKPTEDDDLVHHIESHGATSPVSDASSPSSVSTTSSGVSFVSVSQLASSSSSATVLATSCNSSMATTSNSAATSVTSFTMETAISNVSSPLCSISPLLSSPNKSNDLSFSLGAAISDLARTSSDDGPATSVEVTLDNGQQNPYVTSSPGYGLADLSTLNPHQQPFSARDFNESPSTVGVTTTMDKGQQKEHQQQQHSMHYVPHEASLPHMPQQQQQQIHVDTAVIMGHHQHSGPITGGSDHGFPSASQVPSSFCHGYSTPLTHHHHHQHSGSAPDGLNGGTSGLAVVHHHHHHHQNSSDVNGTKSKSSVGQHRMSMNTNDMTPAGVQLQRSQSVHLCPDNSQMVSNMSGAHHRGYQNPVTRMHTLNHQSPQAQSPKLGGDIHHGHSPIGSAAGIPHPVTSSSPKHGMRPTNTSPGRNTLPTPPTSSPAAVASSFVPHNNSHLLAGAGYDGFRDLHLNHGSQKRLNHQPPPPSESGSPARTVSISYSAESLIQTQPRQRSNCAREGQQQQQQVAPTVMNRNLGTVPGSQTNFAQNHQEPSSFSYFGLPQPSTEQLRPSQIRMTMPPTSLGAPLKHASPNQTSGPSVKQCVSRSSNMPDSVNSMAQPNFSFSLMQHTPVLAEHQFPQQHQRGVHPASQDVSNFRHNNYFAMGNYGSHHQMGAPMPPPGLQCSSGGQKNVQNNPPPPFHHVAQTFPPSSNQQLGGNAQMGSSRGQMLPGTTFMQQGVENGSGTGVVTFGESPSYQMHGAIPSLGAQSSTTIKASYKSKSGTKPESSTNKTSKSKQQTSRKKHHQQQQQQQQQQHTMEEVNLSNSIFETGRSLTPYFSISNLSPPRNEAPTYIPNANPLFNTAQRASAPSSGMQQSSKTTDLSSAAAYNPLFAPRNQGGTLNLNFQSTSGFSVNHLHHGGNTGTNQIAAHTPSGPPPPPHVPNFNLSNIFPDINGSSDSINISPIKFHHPGNHILPPPSSHQPSSSMDHQLQHHHQSASLYHNRSHAPPPPPSIHNGMTINSLLGHNPHGFDGRPPQVAMSINNAMTPPFHGHGHTTSFGNVIPTLNFSMHDH